LPSFTPASIKWIATVDAGRAVAADAHLRGRAWSRPSAKRETAGGDPFDPTRARDQQTIVVPPQRRRPQQLVGEPAPDDVVELAHEGMLIAEHASHGRQAIDERDCRVTGELAG
jgi:hypothetical protein